MGTARRLLAAHALASVAMSLPWPLLVLLVWEQAGPRADLLVGLTGAARMLPYVALSWATGRLADRFRRDRIVRATLLARLVCLAALTAALAAGLLPLAVLSASLAVACGTPAYPALAAAMPAAAGTRRRRATDLLVTVEVASFVVGPALGGLLLAPATRPWIGAVALGATALALVPLRPVVLPAPAYAGSARPGTWSVVRRSPAVLCALLVVAVLNGVASAVALVLLPLSDQVWDDGASGFGLATAALGFGAVGGPALWWLGRSARARARAGLAVLAGALLGVALAPSLAWVAPLLVAVGAVSVHVEAAVTETVQDAVPDAHRAGVLGLTDSVMVAAALLGALVTPALGRALGPAVLVVLLAAACALATVAPRRVVVEGLSPRGAPAVPEQRRRQDGPARPRARSSSAAAPRG